MTAMEAWRWLTRGAIGALVALGALAVAHRAGDVLPLAPLSVADRIVRLTPAGLATWAVEHVPARRLPRRAVR